MAMGLFTLAPFLGSVVGPIAGAWVAEKSNWQWVFWSTSIFEGLVQILALFYLKESTYFDFAISKVTECPWFQHMHRFYWNAKQRRPAELSVTLERDVNRRRLGWFTQVLTGSK